MVSEIRMYLWERVSNEQEKVQRGNSGTVL